MSAPYRDSDGVACPRCGATLLADGADRVCPDGCGTWIAQREVTALVGQVVLGRITHNGPYWKATALPQTRCLVCRRELEALYPAISGDDILTLGACAEHGVWLEGRDRRAFLAAYRMSITLAAQSPPAERASVEDRIRALEDRVARLEELLRRR